MRVGFAVVVIDSGQIGTRGPRGTLFAHKWRAEASPYRLLLQGRFRRPYDGGEVFPQTAECDMTSGLLTYRVEAYNTAKLSENKMHDDTVARRFGFSGGLVPGVDVMAYMMHLPIAKWGRAFLERGLIEARLVKPVYDGEIAEVRGEERDGTLAIEVESRGQLCAYGTASLPASAPVFSLSDYIETTAVDERRPV